MQPLQISLRKRKRRGMKLLSFCFFLGLLSSLFSAAIAQKNTTNLVALPMKIAKETSESKCTFINQTGYPIQLAYYKERERTMNPVLGIDEKISIEHCYSYDVIIMYLGVNEIKFCPRDEVNTFTLTLSDNQKQLIAKDNDGCEQVITLEFSLETDHEA